MKKNLDNSIKHTTDIKMKKNLDNSIKRTKDIIIKGGLESNTNQYIALYDGYCISNVCVGDIVKYKIRDKIIRMDTLLNGVKSLTEQNEQNRQNGTDEQNRQNGTDITIYNKLARECKVLFNITHNVKFNESIHYSDNKNSCIEDGYLCKQMYDIILQNWEQHLQRCKVYDTTFLVGCTLNRLTLEFKYRIVLLLYQLCSEQSSVESDKEPIEQKLQKIKKAIADGKCAISMDLSAICDKNNNVVLNNASDKYTRYNKSNNSDAIINNFINTLKLINFDNSDSFIASTNSGKNKFRNDITIRKPKYPGAEAYKCQLHALQKKFTNKVKTTIASADMSNLDKLLVTSSYLLKIDTVVANYYYQIELFNIKYIKMLNKINTFIYDFIMDNENAIVL